MTLSISFNGEFVATAEDESKVKRVIADHLGTWAGNGVTARILGSRPIVSQDIDGYQTEVESRRGAVYTIHTYRIVEIT